MVQTRSDAMTGAAPDVQNDYETNIPIFQPPAAQCCDGSGRLMYGGVG